MLLGGAWALCQAVTLVRRGGGWSGVVAWAGWAWLSVPFLLLGGVLWLARTGDFGFSVSGMGVGWSVYFPNSLTGQWITAAELLTLWLGPGLALLWWGRSRAA
ncbi:hypothetical protein ACFP81_06270 [Deinococcus lacus]|uniref:Lycopene cyclase domain-containing protein n=1 Tax=Deinococcus lacus TaxID=392561 RepID=A0ABW1YE08_9DEIO